MPTNEPEDARPKWMDPDAQDEAPIHRPGSASAQPGTTTWQRVAEWRREREEAARQSYATADPQDMAMRELVQSVGSGSGVDYQQLHATRAAAWASLAVLRELRTQRRER